MARNEFPTLPGSYGAAFNLVISPADQPAYVAAEAARIVGVPASTAKAWAFGQQQNDGRRFRAVIAPADRQRKLLSFANLCELHVLATIRRVHRIPMPSVRRSLQYVGKELGTERPLIAQRFYTNGIELFIERAGELVNASTGGQQALREGFELALARIDWGDRGGPVRLFPFTRSAPSLADQPKAVVVDPNIAFGRPALVRCGVTTEVIQDRFLAGDDPQEMARDYAVDASDIMEAIRFAA